VLLSKKATAQNESVGGRDQNHLEVPICQSVVQTNTTGGRIGRLG
jgi:hypothetical protein